MTKQLLKVLFGLFLFISPMYSQVTIGEDKIPEKFSVLELVSNGVHGMRLPQMSNEYRNIMEASDEFQAEIKGEALGLAIFNTSTKCVEVWNGTQWLTMCAPKVKLTGVILSRTDGSGPVIIGQKASLLATVTLSDPFPSNVTYTWEIWDGVEWFMVAETTTNTYNAIVSFLGDNTYRVIAANDQGYMVSNTVVVEGINLQNVEPEPSVLMYVGAFWKANQTGERLIRIPVGDASLNNSGQWQATVSWLQPGAWGKNDGVVLSKTRSLDPNVNRAGFTPNLAENYKVLTDSTMITGTAPPNGYIQFRIGLQQNFASYDANTNPARYAIVLLTYGNGKTRRLFIRQGEGADYLMRQNEPTTSLASRPNAKKFSPYNLKDAQHRIPPNANTVYFSATNKAVWVDYPTMTGYLVPYNYSYFSAPTIEGLMEQPIQPSQWNINAWWSTQAPDACPNGFKRPNDGSTSAAGAATVANSEMRQSLWSNPQNGGNATPSINNAENSVGGIYADGYYDRGVIEQVGGLGTAGKFSVFWNFGANPTPTLNGLNANSNFMSGIVINPLWLLTGSSGRLFFNPETNASLFFPASGISQAINQLEITFIGESGAYWTSTAYSLRNGGTYGRASYMDFSIWNGDTQPPVARMSSVDGANHMSVRCVAQ